MILAENTGKIAMDEFDYRIIRELQQNGRITNQELSERVSLSPSPCLRRLRTLESDGIIAGYTIVIDQEKFGRPVSLFVRVRIDQHNKKAIEEFERGVKTLVEVVSCYLISGKYDYLLQIVSEDSRWRAPWWCFA